MEDWTEIVIPVVMFLLPLVAAAIDKKIKGQKKPGQVTAVPVSWPQEDADAEDDWEEDARPVASARQNPVFAEGERTVARKAAILVEEPEREKRSSISLTPEEKKKLILYSEILKPKFDA